MGLEFSHTNNQINNISRSTKRVNSNKNKFPIQLSEFEGFNIKNKEFNCLSCSVHKMFDNYTRTYTKPNTTKVLDIKLDKIDKLDQILNRKLSTPTLIESFESLDTESHSSTINDNYKEDLINLSFTKSSRRPTLLDEYSLVFEAGNKELTKGKTNEDNGSEYLTKDNNNYNDNNRIRNSYYTKLILNQFIRQNLAQSTNNNGYNTVVILDWDDTIMCSTFIFPYIQTHLKNLPEEERQHIKLLELAVINFLNYCIQRGDTYIVTNANTGWVEYSTALLFPEVKKLLSKINIHSARDTYERAYPNDNRKWKMKTFLQITEKYSKDKLLNVISIGDSVHELESAFNLRKRFKDSVIKTVKMKEKPSIVELVKQLRVVYKDKDKIFDTPNNLTISIDNRKDCKKGSTKTSK